MTFGYISDCLLNKKANIFSLKNSISDLEMILKHFANSNYFNTEPDFGALFLNYFGYSNEKNMELFFQNIDLYDLYVHYMNMLVCDKTKTGEKKFTDIQSKVN